MSSPPKLRADRASRLRAALLAWYAAEQRDLPWRRTRDAYAIWISEAMLQQTRVATVIDYWTRFLGRFPRVQDLAAADEQDVLGLWSGLGYYSRARGLQAAAKVICERHDGRFPRTRAEALALPGVGEYTAGAVLSIAYDLPEPLVDGNVERVLARLFGLPGAAGSPVLRKAAWSLAADLVPEQGAGAWNQALMELGAGPCSPRTPACGDCPWQRSCHAARSGDPAAIPAPKPRKKPVDLELEGAWIWRDGALCLVQRPADGPMAGLWELPTRRLTDGIGEHLWSAAWPGRLSPRLGGPAWEARHSITHHRIRMRVFPAQAARPAGGTWFTAEELRDLAVTGLTKKALAQLLP